MPTIYAPTPLILNPLEDLKKRKSQNPVGGETLRSNTEERSLLPSSRDGKENNGYQNGRHIGRLVNNKKINDERE